MSEELKSSKQRMSTENIVGLVLICVFLPIIIFNMVVFALSIINPSKVPMPLGVAPIVVGSDSMTIREDALNGGAFNKGDLIFIRKVKVEKLKVGDIITFDRAGEIITHRITSIDNIEEVFNKAKEAEEAAKAAYEAAPEGAEKDALYKEYEKARNNRAIEYSRKVVSEKRGFGTIYVTMGDYESSAPIDVYEDQIQAIYTGIRLPLFGNVLEFFQEPLGLVILICVPVGIYFAYEIIKRSKKNNASEQKIAELEAKLAMQQEAKQEEAKEQSEEQNNAE